MSRKKVSVIVPAFNVEQYLAQCLDSLVSQSLESIEVVVVNDGSSDETGSIADGYQLRYPDVVSVHHKPNGGLSDARNFGIDRATGEYIGFVDSDDWVAENMYELLLGAATDNEADVVACAAIEAIPHEGREKLIPLRELDNFGYSLQQRPHLLYSAHSYACNKLFKRELFTDSGIQFPVGQWFEDSATIYNVMSCANRVVGVDVPLYYYRRGHAGTITRSVDPRMFDSFKSCDSIVSWFTRSGIYHGEVPVAVERVARRHIVARFEQLWNAADRKFSWAYISEYFSYMDRMFPGWRTRYEATWKSAGMKGLAKRYRTAAWVYLHCPQQLRSMLEALGRLFRRVARALARRLVAPVRRRQFRSRGLSVFSMLDGALGSIGITYFADFGTMLGFIREGGFLRHDKDVDLGVIAAPCDRSRVRDVIEEAGARLWRQWILDGEVVEESYHLVGKSGAPLLKFDVNYYVTSATGTHTWLFYREPNRSYRPGERSTVRMSYGPISGVRKITIHGLQIPVPIEAERLLVEKYGSNWRAPDKQWRYWESPAAEKLDCVGYYVQHT